MSAGWVAATTRGRAFRRRLVGGEGARAMAEASWPDARSALSNTFYGADLAPDSDRGAAARVAVEATMWQLRVFAGWLPPNQSVLARLFAAPIEIANIERHLARLNGRPTDPPFRLGSLAVAWPRVAAARSPEQVRGALATSVWGDPGGSDCATVSLTLRVNWARRLSNRLPETDQWARGATAVLVAREMLAFDRAIADPVAFVIDDLLGRHWREASSISTFVDRLPPSASWALHDLHSPADLWMAELEVMKRASEEATLRAETGRYGRPVVTATMALLLVDLWRVRGAIALAGRSPIPEEFFDAVA
jgi:hypothetical protein